MKKIHLFIFYVMLVVQLANAQTQFVYNFTTGWNDATNSIAVPGQNDDNWEVCYPNSTVFQPAKVSTGVKSDNVAYSPIFANTRVITPALDAFNRCDIIPDTGTFTYRYTFNLPSCSPPIASTHFTLTGGDYEITSIKLNALELGYAIGPGISQLASYYVNWSPPLVHTNPGLNTLIVKVHKPAGMSNYNMLYLGGTFSFITTSQAAFDLTDQNLNIKNQFCLGENVFMNTSQLPAGFQLTLQQLSGNTYNTLASGAVSNLPNSFNVKQYFENNFPVVFQSGVIYKIIVGVSSPCVFNLEKTFSFTCCTGVADATFNLQSLPNNGLLAQSNSSGQHTWIVNHINPNTGQLIGGPLPISGNGPSFTLNSGGPCFLVKHTVTNECGTACSIQKMCSSSCDIEPCSIPSPSNIMVSPSNNITWNPVPGAQNYILIITANDPNCCGGAIGGSGLGQIPQTKTVTVSTPNYQINPYDFHLEEMRCYSIKIASICPDGTMSAFSPLKCVNVSQ